jgi:hyperosmotically inducible periplasmic protein
MSALHPGVSRLRSYAVAALALTLLITCASFGQDQQTTSDNSANNKTHSQTADQQSSATSDRMLTKKIRQSLIADKSLSTYGHNVKIITQNGVVTLKGPVQSEEEKQTIASKAAEIAGGPDKVTDQLSIKQ